MRHTEIPSEVKEQLYKGVVIPALPLALNENRQLDERRQRALIRYYLDAGAGGVGPHAPSDAAGRGPVLRDGSVLPRDHPEANSRSRI